jgi:large subunit ribosomal protein L29
MKVTERSRKMRDMSVDELRRHEAEMVEQIFKLRFQIAMGQAESLNKFRELRRDRARLLTILREKES